MITFTTKSGSQYYLDKDNKVIMRLTGKNQPQPYQGTDGEWKHFSEIFGPKEGTPCFIFYKGYENFCVITSVVKNISESENY